MRLRLIPVVIVLAALGLSFRAGSIVDLLTDQEPSRKTPAIGVAIAQDASAVPPVPGDNGNEMTPLELDKSDVPIIDGTDDGMHPTEARLANSLAQRRMELDTRERELEQRSAMLGVVEARLADTQKNLEGIRDEIQQLVAKYEGLEDEEIFDTMELDTILSVIRGMNDRKLAPILEAMDPNKAVIVTQEINAREELPTFNN